MPSGRQGPLLVRDILSFDRSNQTASSYEYLSNLTKPELFSCFTFRYNTALWPVLYSPTDLECPCPALVRPGPWSPCSHGPAHSAVMGHGLPCSFGPWAPTVLVQAKLQGPRLLYYCSPWCWAMVILGSLGPGHTSLYQEPSATGLGPVHHSIAEWGHPKPDRWLRLDRYLSSGLCEYTALPSPIATRLLLRVSLQVEIRRLCRDRIGDKIRNEKTEKQSPSMKLHGMVKSGGVHKWYGSMFNRKCMHHGDFSGCRSVDWKKEKLNIYEQHGKRVKKCLI